MKKRILTLALALILLLSAVTIPARAATAKDVYNFLKSYAMSGTYNSAQKVYTHSFSTEYSEYTGGFYVRYLEKDKYVELSYTDSETYEIALRISSNPSPAYNAYFWSGNGADIDRGTFSVTADYNGEPFTSFKTYSGEPNYLETYLEWMSTMFPFALENFRTIIYDNGFTLQDLGLSYRRCDHLHYYGQGRVIKEPTCVGYGMILYTCAVCDAMLGIPIDPTGIHTFDGGVVITEPTCTAEGLTRYTCTGCNRVTKDETIPALGHAWTLTEVLTEAEEGGLHACTGLYTCARCNETKEAPLCAAEVFTDMPAEGNWAHDPIDWAYFNGITSGKTATTFAPKDVVTRAEAMTFLWKTVGSPEPEAEENPFTDVPEGKYFYKPVMWAVENDVTGGATETTFAPKQKCTRAQIMMFLWAAAGRPEPETTENPFTDVPSTKYYYKAILWAVENGVTGGIAPDKFGPNNTCTRAQIVTFLYKAQDLLCAPEPPVDSDY